MIDKNFCKVVAFIFFLAALLPGVYIPDYTWAETGRIEDEYNADGSLKKEYLLFDDAGNVLEYNWYTGAMGRFARLHFICTYDDIGFLMTEKIILDDGTPWQFYTNEYDGNGYLIRRFFFYEEGGLPVTIMENEYDNQGKCAAQTDHNLITGKTKRTELNASGKVIYEKVLLASGAEDYSAFLSYDPEGRLTEYKVMKPSGKVSFVQYNEYDDQGRVQRSTVYDDGSVLRIESIYDYSEEGFIETEYSHFQYIGGSTVTEYDLNGLALLRKHYDQDGILTGSETMEYNEDGEQTIIIHSKAEGTEGYHIENTYNARGSIILQIRYEMDGSRNIRTYNDYGLITGDKTRSVDGLLLDETLYDEYGNRVITRLFDEETGKISCEALYNDRGQQIRWNTYMDGKLAYYELYEYDVDGNKTNEIQVYPDS